MGTKFQQLLPPSQYILIWKFWEIIKILIPSNLFSHSSHEPFTIIRASLSLRIEVYLYAEYVTD